VLFAGLAVHRLFLLLAFQAASLDDAPIAAADLLQPLTFF